MLFFFLSVKRYSGRKNAMLFLIFLTSMPAFLKLVVAQYADIVFSCYVLIGIISFFLAFREGRGDYMAIGGLSLGFAALTKNEGLLILISVNLAALFLLFKQHNKLIKPYLKSLSISLVPVATWTIFGAMITPLHKIFFSPKEINLCLFFQRVKELLFFVSSGLFKLNLFSLFWYIFFAVVLLYKKNILRKGRAILTLPVLFIMLGYLTAYAFRIGSNIEDLNFLYQRFTMHILPVLCFLIADTVLSDNPA
jgi:hypothetical protein